MRQTLHGGIGEQRVSEYNENYSFNNASRKHWPLTIIKNSLLFDVVTRNMFVMSSGAAGSSQQGRGEAHNFISAQFPRGV